MITVLYPASTNWFYERFAHALVEDMRRLGVVVRGLASSQISTRIDDRAAILIINYTEIVFDCARRDTVRALRKTIASCDKRVLVNMDSFRTAWFEKQIEEGFGLFTDVFDYGMIPQHSDDRICGLPLQWVKEALSAKVKQDIPPTRGRRPIPWAFIGHETKGRAAFVAAAVQTLPEHGFVYVPHLKPFSGTYGLDEAALTKVLRSSTFYIWGSHHHHPYHECLRACDGIASGAIPVKIDPLYHDEMDLPWVYPSLEAFKCSQAYADPDIAYRTAVARLGENGGLGENFVAALATIGLSLTANDPCHA